MEENILGKAFLVKCDCGCSILEFQDDKDAHQIYISHYASSFYNHRNTIRTNIVNRLKLIWCAITGKDYYFYDLVLSKEDSLDFKQQMKEFLDG